MKLQQLQYLSAIVRHELNVSAAAKRLRTSQSALSKQIRQLEQELGVQIFLRKARQFTGLTDAGQALVERAQAILRDRRDIEAAVAESPGAHAGAFAIGTTHTQARYVLPRIIGTFVDTYPKVRLHLRQGTVEQIAQMFKSERIDVALATGSRELFDTATLMPCYQWNRCVLVPRGHALAQVSKLSLRDLAEHPLITYAFSLSGPSSLQSTFARAGLTPHIAITAWDADVIKTYVRRRMGVGIVAEMALGAAEDQDLVCLDATHLFAAHVTWIAVGKDTVPRASTYDFLHWCAPHLERTTVERAIACRTQAEVDVLFNGVVLPRLPATGRLSAWLL